jgi:hypothetical protein
MYIDIQREIDVWAGSNLGIDELHTVFDVGM